MIHRKKNDLLYKDATSLCHSLWHSDFTCKQVVNRLKIPQGFSTLLFRRWSKERERERGRERERKRERERERERGRLGAGND